MSVYTVMTKAPAKFKEIGIKIHEELRTQGTHRLCTFTVFKPEKWLSFKLRKRDKN